MKRNLVLLTLLSVALLGLAIGTAAAGLLNYGVRQIFSTAVTSTFGSTTIVPINDSGATSLTFTTAGTQPVLIAYNADCKVTTPGTAVAIEILVDGTPAPGTGAGSGGALLCSTTTFEAAIRHVVPVVSAGSHIVQVRLAIFSSSAGTYTAQLERTVLTVET